MIIEERWENAKLFVGLFIFVLVLFGMVVLAVSEIARAVSKQQHFENNRRIVKICNDGTRIYEYEHRTVTIHKEQILPEACL